MKLKLFPNNVYEIDAIDEIFTIIKICDSFAIARKITPPTHMFDYEETIGTLIKDKNVCYIYVKLKKDLEYIPTYHALYNKGIVASSDSLYLFLLDEMENDFKNCSIDIDKIAFYECCSNYIKEHKNIPTLKDFYDSGKEILIYEKNGEWTLEVIKSNPSFHEYLLYIEGIHPIREYNKHSLINHIRRWIKNNMIDSRIGKEKTRQILILLKYFIGYDLYKDKEEYSTKIEIDYLNKVIDECSKRIAELKIGSLDNE